MENYDVVVIGGGTTGTAVIRDLVLRGFTKSVLLERDDLAAGTSGGCHSALHGGSRYVVSDIQTAKECLHENKIYKKIVPQVVDPTDALWVARTEEHMKYAKQWMKNADEIGLPYEVADVKETLEDEPLLADDIQFAIRTIDTGFDPFRLCIAQAYDAKSKGAVIKTHTEVVALLFDPENDKKIRGVKVLNRLTNEIYDIGCKLVINASGAWGSQVTEMAGFKIPVKPNKGTMGVYAMRPTKALIGILRYPGDGDGLVSQGYQNTSLLGTSSVDIEDPDTQEPGLEEVQIMEDSVAEIIPELRNARMIRFCSGVRPLYSETSETGRDVSRRMILLDHEERDGYQGLITITGGKYATARLMAEETVDLASEKLVGKVIPCTSADELILGAITHEEAEKLADKISHQYNIPQYTAHKLAARYGSIAETIVREFPEHVAVIDDSVQIIGSEVLYAMREEEVGNILDIRRRIRNGMGQDQGTFSTYKVSILAKEFANKSVETCFEKAQEYTQERWKGMYYALQYAQQVQTATLLQKMHVGFGNLDCLDIV